MAIPLASNFINLDHGSRPIQREVFQGVPMPGGLNAPEAGTIVRIYSAPRELTGDFDDDGQAETVRAITEVAGPLGVDPCPGGPDGDGCTQGERIVQHPFFSSSGKWTMPAEFSSTRSEGNLDQHEPRTFEIRFTEEGSGSYAYHAFGQAAVQHRVTMYPIEIWDIGEVPVGSANDPSDDIRMALVAFSDDEGECDFGYDEFELEENVWATDRLYAYYFNDGITYDDYHGAIADAIPIVLELKMPLTGQRRFCTDGAVGLFECSGVDLMSYLPLEWLGVNAYRITDVWGWADSVTGKEYALVAAVDRIPIVDVTDPANPVLVAHVRGDAQDIKVYADHLYGAVDAHPPVMIFDLKRLRNVANTPVELDPDTTYFASAHNLAINEDTGFLYLGGETGGFGLPNCPSLHIVDIREPLRPTFVNCFVPEEMIGMTDVGYVHDAQCVIYQGPDSDYTGREICFTSSETHITVVDVEDKNAPRLISFATYPAAGYVHQGWLTEDHHYFIQGDETDEFEGARTRTYIWDVRDLDNPEVLTVFESTTQSTDHNLYVSGHRLYQANYSSGLRVLDISTIEDPREIAYFDTYPLGNQSGFDGAWTAYPFLSNSVVVSSQTEGLFLLSVNPAVSVEPREIGARSYTLSQNYPNPFLTTTEISFSLPLSGKVRINVYDVLGREVAQLLDTSLPSGEHKVNWDASGLPSGVYFYSMNSNAGLVSRSAVIAK
ncbi:MAG: choice-of-anchor B family protein [Rhodothermia bacterium]|nr:choice-of-anchor B family protein [Rhodothermia bacterium]